MERLLDAGALDVTLQPIEMKKGRPGTLLRVLAKPEDRDRLAGIIFAETSTLGLRMYSAERRGEARRGGGGGAPPRRGRREGGGDGGRWPPVEGSPRPGGSTGAGATQNT